MLENFSENFRENWKNVNTKNLTKTGKRFGKFNKGRRGNFEEILKNFLNNFWNIPVEIFCNLRGYLEKRK